MYEVRIHSRGGQGGVTAARLLALAAFRDGKYATACPFYGAERRGAPVVSYVRIDDRPVRICSHIRSPDMVVVLDPGIMEVADILTGLKPGGKVLVNAKACTIPGRDVLAIDLTEIALRSGIVHSGSPILNTPVLGALARMGVITLGSARAAIREVFTDERNIDAAVMAYGELAA